MDLTSQLSLQALQASTQAGPGGPPAADPASINRFQQLLEQPGLAADGQGDFSHVIRNQSEHMSSMWSSAQHSMENLLKKNGDLSMKDVLQLQYDMVKTSATFEVVSKAAGMTEKGTESLFQRN